MVGAIGSILGLIFTLVVTRTLLPEEFGTWGLLLGLFGNIILFEPIVGFWVTRQIARGIPSARTAIFTTSLFSMVAVFVFLIVVNFIINPIDVDLNILFFGSILIPVIFLNRTLNAICLGHKPHIASMGQLVFGIVQVLTVLFFVFYLNLGIIGLIISVFISYIGSIIIQTVYSKEQLKNKINKKIIKKWLKISWLPLYPGIANTILRFDIVIFTVLTGSVIGIAYWTVATTLAQLITIIGGISVATYSKVLEEKNKDFFQDHLTHLFFFAIPFTAIVLVVAKPGLFLLNPFYVIAYPVVIILSIQILLNVFYMTFQSVILGSDSVDNAEKSTIKQYVKSKLFFMPTLLVIQFTSHIIILTMVILLLSDQSSEIELVIYWSMILLITQIPITIYAYFLSKKEMYFKLNIKSISKYLLVGIVVFGSMFVLTQNYFNYDEDIYNLILKLLLVILIGFGSYSLGTYVLDLKVRNLFQSIFSEIKK
jgi:O-antigen/teichoic acid export membrane protein